MNSKLYIIIIALLLTGCKSTGFLMGKAKTTMLTEVSYPPKSEDSSIDIYVTSKPDKPYTEFAIIACNDTNNEWCLKQVKTKAKEIGADGIIVLGDASSAGSGIAAGNTYIVTEGRYGIRVVAIKYK